MGKKILITIVLLVWAFAIITIFVWEPKKTEYTIKVYYPAKDPETITVNARGHLHLSDGCIRDNSGNDYVCGVAHFEVIK